MNYKISVLDKDEKYLCQPVEVDTWAEAIDTSRKLVNQHKDNLLFGCVEISYTKETPDNDYSCVQVFGGTSGRQSFAFYNYRDALTTAILIFKQGIVDAVGVVGNQLYYLRERA